MLAILIVVFVLLSSEAHSQFAIFQAASNGNFLLDGSGGFLLDGSGGKLRAA